MIIFADTQLGIDILNVIIFTQYQMFYTVFMCI